MACIQLTNVGVLDNPSTFNDPFSFEISFECISELSDDLEFKLVYVGSASGPEHDQELESVQVGPIGMGIHKFIFKAPPPNPEKIPQSDFLGVTVILLSAYYQAQEFVRVGFYVTHEYDGKTELSEEELKSMDISKITRNILDSKPRVTNFDIAWGVSPAPIDEYADVQMAE
eukprot:CAMPEP_0174260360 /NCGR_PEP_ID=MMETSP0439-20130205/9663_1 /TAXON_ID=0 /ORGANISM="Stereomyxa ramosa, Strain Chinc5" /LENGTH=171 /DNA_ID=CAMNT_0015344587 /DNA_START=6 /DNA_END=521 /DNA_ORIENTATION=-